MSDDDLTAMLEALVEANPQDGGAWSTLGVLLRRNGKLDSAIACHRRGLEATPGHAAIWSNLGNALVECGRFDEGRAAHAQAMHLEPETPSSLFNSIVALRKSAAFKDALTLLDRALANDPGSPALLWERALTLLQTGYYRQGFEDYEARRNLPTYRNRVAPGPEWDGRPLNGRTLFLSTEQGFGDALLAARYVPLVKAKGGRLLLECHAELQTVLSGLGVDEFVPTGAPFPAYDLQASLLSLPRLCGTTMDSVPPPVRLTIPESARAKAARVLGPAQAGCLRVGIVWSGRVTFADNLRRATTLSRFLRFAEIPGIRLYSLQKGPPEDQLSSLGTNKLVVPLGPHLDDFADTAAMLEHLDLVIMTDSSVAHLASSLGRPVWNLVQYVPYWIYGFAGDSTPWYPSMRLFRQGRDQDWQPVFENVAQALREFPR